MKNYIYIHLKNLLRSIFFAAHLLFKKKKNRRASRAIYFFKKGQKVTKMILKVYKNSKNRRISTSYVVFVKKKTKIGARNAPKNIWGYSISLIFPYCAAIFFCCAATFNN